MFDSSNIMKTNVLGFSKRIAAPAVALMLVGMSFFGGCRNKEGGENVLPKGGENMSDTQKVEYMMKQTTPDSVARFICRAALGQIEGVKIDTLSNATLYAYENYRDDDLQTFSQAYESFIDSLPLNLKMRLHKLEAEQDPMGLGYELGLGYVNVIRMEKKDAASIEKEIENLRQECMKSPEDTATFTRFKTGFKVALDMDGSSDVPKSIYLKYSSH